MVQTFNLGSINLDYTIKVTHFARAGETIEGEVANVSLGGKGMNITIALQKAGQQTFHIGAMNKDDVKLRDMVDGFDIDQQFIEQSEHPSGQAYVFLDKHAENSIVVCGGANHQVSSETIERALQSAKPGDWLVMQNETNGQNEAIRIAKEKQMKIALVAAPFDVEAVKALIGDIDMLALNETEASELEKSFDKKIENLNVPFVLQTMGAKGAVFFAKGKRISIEGISVTPVDTTGAGDTFFGFFLASWIRSGDQQEALEIANKAASIAVQHTGAAVAIPALEEVLRN